MYTVPLDAVQPDGDGMDVIQVRQPDGRFAPVRVQTGMKNDYAVEISGAAPTCPASRSSGCALPAPF